MKASRLILLITGIIILTLEHNGQVLARNSREVIMTDGSVISVNQDRWKDFLTKQKELVEEMSSGDEVKSK